MTGNKFLILIPAYNESASIGKLLEDLKDSGAYDYADVLVIDDHSSDRTGRIAREHGAATVRNIFNLGYGSALQLGYKYAVNYGYQYVIQMDADGQHDASNVKKIYDALLSPSKRLNGAQPDIVLGSRFLPGSVSFPSSGIKLFAIKFFRLLIHWLTGGYITDPTSGLQGLDRAAFYFYSEFNNFNSRYPDANMFIQMIMKGFSYLEIPAVMHERKSGKSMHSGIFKPAYYMIFMVLSVVTTFWRENSARIHKIGDSGKGDEY